LYHSTLGLRVIKKKKKADLGDELALDAHARPALLEPLLLRPECLELGLGVLDARLEGLDGHVLVARLLRGLRRLREREFFIDNLLVRIHFIVEMILVNRPCAMGV